MNQIPLCQQINSTLEAFKPSVGTKMEGLLLNSDSDSDFDPRAPDNDSPSQMGLGGSNGNKISNDLFGFEPPKQSIGQQLFSSSSNNHTSFTNGNSGITSNGFGAPTSPPPMRKLGSVGEIEYLTLNRFRFF